jgi:hypothetical protein
MIILYISIFRLELKINSFWKKCKRYEINKIDWTNVRVEAQQVNVQFLLVSFIKNIICIGFKKLKLDEYTRATGKS